MNFIQKEHQYSLLGKMCYVLAFVTVSPALCLAVPSGHPLAALVLCAVGVTPLLLLRKSAKKLDSAAQANFDAFIKRLGAVDASAYASGSGIAVQLKDKLLSLKEDDTEKTYSFGQVRSWKWVLTTPGRVEADDMGQMGVAAAKNAQMMTRAKFNTGIFINVKDIDHPVWHVRLRDQGTLNRWHEILNQALGDAEAALQT